MADLIFAMVLQAAWRVVGAANECLHLTTTCATAVRTDSILSSFLVLAACVAALGEGLGLIERGNSPLLCAARNGL